jgi:type I restriction enzyme S subunit
MDGEFRCYEWRGDKALLNQRVCRVQDFDSLRIVPRFVFFLLDEHLIRIERNTAFTTVKHISTKQIEAITFDCPPLRVQQRIVDLMSAVDEYIAALQRQADAARTARNAVLHELLTTGGDEWIETTLGQVTDVVMGRQLSPNKKLGLRPRPYLRAANIGSWGISLDEVFEMDFTETEEEQFSCRVGDVLLVEGGNEKSVGCPALVGDREAGLCIQNTIIRCRIQDKSSLTPEFLYQLLRHNFWMGKFGELCAGTTIMHLGQKRAAVFPLVLPPVKEQNQIVGIVSSMDDVIRTTETAITKSKTLRAGLLSDLLSGEHEIPDSYDRLLGAA